MCMSCGCKQPNEDHGDQRNITMQDLQAAGQASDIGAQEVVRNIQQGFEEFGQGGQYAGAGVQGAQKARGQTGTQGTTGQQQRTGNNEQDYEQRQGGYGTGGSNSPQ